jgi:hypothetical protein
MRGTCETNTNSQTKRVSVRTGGAGHAHSGIVRSEIQSAKNALADGVSLGRVKAPNGKIVKLGR